MWHGALCFNIIIMRQFYLSALIMLVFGMIAGVEPLAAQDSYVRLSDESKLVDGLEFLMVGNAYVSASQESDCFVAENIGGSYHEVIFNQTVIADDVFTSESLHSAIVFKLVAAGDGWLIEIVDNAGKYNGYGLSYDGYDVVAVAIDNAEVFDVKLHGDSAHLSIPARGLDFMLLLDETSFYSATLKPGQSETDPLCTYPVMLVKAAEKAVPEAPEVAFEGDMIHLSVADGHHIHYREKIVSSEARVMAIDDASGDQDWTVVEDNELHYKIPPLYTGQTLTLEAKAVDPATGAESEHFVYQTQGKLSSLDGITINDGSETEYFNLHGVSVSNEKLAPGVYVTRRGGMSRKVVVK